MSEKPIEQTPFKKRRDETAREIAALSGYSAAYVRMVMNGERENDDILAATIIYKQGKSKLIQQVKKLVPF